jgi:hypothetical protein
MILTHRLSFKCYILWHMRIVITCILFLLSLWHGPVMASRIAIELDLYSTEKMPASDLFYQGMAIDELDAIDLIKKRVDLSLLNPVESKLWQNRKLPVSNQQDLDYPSDDVTFIYKDLKASPSEIFRAVVHAENNSQKQFVLVASLDNHTNILRATMLRLLGYDLDVPRYYPKLKIKFKNLEEKKKFIELVGEQTLTKRDRWVHTDVSDQELIIKGFTLEPAELRNVNIHLPLMSRTRQQDRRVFRSLLDIYVLTDFIQDVNKIDWQVGRIFNEQLLLNHSYATEFNNVTMADMAWIHRRLNSLNREEIAKAISLAGYPTDIEALLLEKLLSRINKMSNYLGLSEVFPVNSMITLGNVRGGKLTGGDYQDYVIEFYNADKESPYRFSEIFKLFRTQITFSTLSGLLDSGIQKLLPSLSMEDALADIQSQISDYRRNNASQAGVAPVRAFASPLANGRLFANRNIVFGQYLGSTAPIQLVDSVGADISLGAFGSITGLSQRIMPNFNAMVSVGRTYTHVRAMPDLSTASKQHVKKILVPLLMKKLGRVIKDEFECSIPTNAFVEEDVVSGSTIYYVKYDSKLTNGRQEAIQKRQELIDSGIAASIILIIPIDRDDLCVNEIATNRKKNVQDFIKEFANNETFIINDNLRISGRLSAPIPIPNAPGASINMGSDHNVALLRSIIIRKVNESIEVTIQQQQDLKNGLSQGMNYFIELLNNSNQWTKGKLYSRVFKIKLEDLSEKEEDIALQTLRSLFVSNDRYELHENYKPYELDHNVKNHLHTFRVLWFKTQKLKMNHSLELTVPNKEGQDFSQSERTRKLFSTMSLRRKGNDFHAFIDRAVGSLLGFISLGSSDQDPGQSFMGNSTKKYYMTESELTEQYPLNPTTRIEYIWTGWKKKTKKLENFFKEIENLYKPFINGQLIDRSQFHASPLLRSYDIKTTIILYPSAFSRLETAIWKNSEAVAINTLYQLYGQKEWQDYCARAIDFFGEYGPQVYYGEKTYNCVPVEVVQLLKARKKFPTSRIELSKFINQTYENLFENFNRAEVLKWLGKKNFFASTRITGFREQNHAGQIEYMADTVGQYNTEIGTGLFDAIGSFLGLSPYELKAMSYTPGM